MKMTVKSYESLVQGKSPRRSETNMSMVRYSRKELNEKFGDKQDAEIQRLLAKGTVPDDQLDLSDMPEITDWSNAVRHNQFYRPVKQQTSIRLDADVLAWFKAQGKGYQTRMNEILRDAMLKELKNISKNGSLGSHF
jgi:uncharacterized protein (DUF4415 family)